MRMLRFSAVLLPLMLASALSACGSKGDLVKPTPPATDQQPAASDTTPKPAQDAGH